MRSSESQEGSCQEESSQEDGGRKPAKKACQEDGQEGLDDLSRSFCRFGAT
jgi:hypothetical protein